MRDKVVMTGDLGTVAGLLLGLTVGGYYFMGCASWTNERRSAFSSSASWLVSDTFSVPLPALSPFVCS